MVCRYVHVRLPLLVGPWPSMYKRYAGGQVSDQRRSERSQIDGWRHLKHPRALGYLDHQFLFDLHTSLLSPPTPSNRFERQANLLVSFECCEAS